jgi:hypothetical protein
MYKGLMLEGRHNDRGRVLASKHPFVTVAFFNDNLNPSYWNTEIRFTKPEIRSVSFEIMRVNLFGAVTSVWVPTYIRDEKERNMWAILRLIDPALVEGFSQVTEFPPEWFNENVQTMRVGAVNELEAGRKAIEDGR